MCEKNLPPVHPGEILLEEFLNPLGVSQSLMYGKDPHSLSGFVKADQGAGLKMLLASAKHRDHNVGQSGGINILRAALKNTGSIGMGGR